jgi:hypothetical protein
MGGGPGCPACPWLIQDFGVVNPALQETNAW